MWELAQQQDTLSRSTVERALLLRLLFTFCGSNSYNFCLAFSLCPRMIYFWTGCDASSGPAELRHVVLFRFMRALSLSPPSHPHPLLSTTAHCQLVFARFVCLILYSAAERRADKMLSTRAMAIANAVNFAHAKCKFMHSTFSITRPYRLISACHMPFKCTRFSSSPNAQLSSGLSALPCFAFNHFLLLLLLILRLMAPLL